MSTTQSAPSLKPQPGAQVQELVALVQQQLQGKAGKLPRSRQVFLAGAAAGLAAVLRGPVSSHEASGQLPEELRLKCAQVGPAPLLGQHQVTLVGLCFLWCASTTG